MKTMIVRAVSTFHNSLFQDFRIPCDPGDYYRYCKNPCDFKKVDGIALHCGCGYPVSRTNWECPDSLHFVVSADWNNGFDRNDHGRNNIIIHVSRSL